MTSSPLTSSKWFLPGLSLALGLVILAAAGIGGQLWVGLTGLVVMGGAAVFLIVAGRRSETVRGLRGDGRDERFALIDLRATAFAGLVVISAIIVAWLAEIARGRAGAPYTWLGAVAGLAYLAAAGYQRWRG